MQRLIQLFWIWIAMSVFSEGVTVLAGEKFPPRTIPEGQGAADRFLKLIDRTRVPLQSELIEIEAAAGIRRFRFSFYSESGVRVPGILVRPIADGNRPLVISLHGTGSNKESQRPFLERLARLGFVGISIDGRHFGERMPMGGGGNQAYESAILSTWRTGIGFPFLYDTVWDVLRLLDYVETLNGVDTVRIGLTGISKGGMETYLASAVDKRIAVAIPFIGVQSFSWALEHGAWQSRIGTIQNAVNAAADDVSAPLNAAFVRRFYARVVPGIDGPFDGPSLLPLIAPRPLLVINGDSDERTPLAGVQICAAAAADAYSAAAALNRFELLIQPRTGHAIQPVSEQRAIDWFVKWLRP